MNKKILTLVLALVLVLGSFATVFAAEVPEYTSRDAKIQWLVDQEIVAGRKVNENAEDNDLALNETLTRAEVTKLLVYVLGEEKLANVLQGVMKPFPDVTVNHWANGYISVATAKETPAGRRLVIGYEDGKFYPENNVSYAELATMLVRIVKKDLTDKMEENAIWATTYMKWADEEGLLDGIKYTNSDNAITRAEAFEMIFNALYKLGRYEKATVNFGDVMGIVSKLRAGEIQLNQDEKMTYKITAKTMVTDGTLWRELGLNADVDYLGSLVRLIADKDGNITHIVELGNKVAKPLNRWIDVANKTVSGKVSFLTNDPRYIDLNISNTEESVNLEVNSSTRLFVADVNNNALREFKSLEELFTVYGMIKDNGDYTAYAGYNTSSGINTAKVVVFNNIGKYQGTQAMRRVTDFLNSSYRFQSEDTKGVKEVTDISNIPMFPSVNRLERYDVVIVRDNTNLPYSDYMVIDASNTTSYPLVKVIDLSGRTIVLKDAKGFERSYSLDRDLKVFTNSVKVGDIIQFRAVDNKVISVISIRNDVKELKGNLVDGIYVGTRKATKIQGIQKDNTVKVLVDTINGVPMYETYYVNDADRSDFGALASGAEFYFEVKSWWNNVPVMTNIKKVVEQSDLEAAEALKAYEDAYKAIGSNSDIKATEEYRAKIVAAVEAYKALTADQQKAVDAGSMPFSGVEAAVTTFNALPEVIDGTVKNIVL